jgi:hypothetical protein
MSSRFEEWQRKARERKDGNAYATEHVRQSKAMQDTGKGASNESPIYQAEQRERRYAQGGMHDRIKEAAKRQAKRKG